MWTGKPKGVLQALWGHSILDTSKDVCRYYTLRGQEDDYGNTVCVKSMRELMWDCLRCIKEETLIQTSYNKIGEVKDHIVFHRTPK